MLEFLEITHLADRLMCELSTGEARRVLIGRALVHDPYALVLDEPANSLDLKAMHSFQESIRKIAGSGKSVILVTHNLQDIIPEINRVILIKEGKSSGTEKRRNPDRYVISRKLSSFQLKSWKKEVTTKLLSDENCSAGRVAVPQPATKVIEAYSVKCRGRFNPLFLRQQI